MEEDSERNFQDVTLPPAPGHAEGGGLVGDHSGLPALCTLCRRSLAPEYEATFDLETVGLCGDCKFLLLEDLGTPPQESNRRRQPRRRRRRNRESSSESIENLFSQHARSFRRSSSRTTPSGSRRWGCVISDSESDGLDNLDSFYGESESNVSFGRYRGFRGDSDAISFTTYGGDSDASMDGHSFLDTKIFVQAERSDTNSDSETDIDPMHAAGFYHLLDHLTEIDGSRRGAPPASSFFVHNLPSVAVSDEHENSDGLACAICKDVLPVGIEVNQLPCLHVYHPSCILPWLSARNSCPLCRYELPADDKDDEEGKQHMNNRMEIMKSSGKMLVKIVHLRILMKWKQMTLANLVHVNYMMCHMWILPSVALPGRVAETGYFVLLLPFLVLLVLFWSYG
ncbi:Detected protein of confused Function [Hibiscus syriacus]|uniref:RING-type E3 ubiquitin transferase n=1 Tax=Hibiscus syriacus TaxID=106335 RepID=A0A6A3CKT5_HIBSY|nr:Detected protein of confused Function [Hibiscus syriacus]